MTGHRLDTDRSKRPSPARPRLPPAPTIAARVSGTRRATRAAITLASLLLASALDAGERSHSPSEAPEPVRLAAANARSDMGEEEVRDVMHVMADSLERLGDLIALEGVGGPSEIARRRHAIDAELEVLEELGSLLDDEVSGRRGAGPQLTDHVLIDEHVAEFVRRVASARRFAAKNPPDHGPAARVGSVCENCHRRRGETR